MIVHLKRAFGWNLGRVVPSERETAALDAAGVRDPAVQRYAAWRRSLLLVAFFPALLAALLAALDVAEDGLEPFTGLGAALMLAFVVAAFGLPVACVAGIRRWTQPGTGARTLLGVWLVGALAVPFAFALLPDDVLHRYEEVVFPDAAAELPSRGGDDANDVREAEKVAALEELALHLVYAAAAFLLLLPAVISLLPAAMNGCLRVKSLLPAAALPGWLLVSIPPVFLLFWLTFLVLASPGLQDPLFVLGVVLWAGGPLAYALRGRVFVRPQIGDADERRIGRARRAARLVSLTGIALLLVFLCTGEVAELKFLGTDPELAMDARLAEVDEDGSPSFWEVLEAYADSDALVYVLDPSFVRMLVDVLAKLLLVTAVFAHLVLRATLAAWRDEQGLRARPEVAAFDGSAGAALAALAPPGPSPSDARASVRGDGG